MDMFYWVAICGPFALLVWWVAPIAIVRRFTLTTDKERADLEDNYRKTMGQAIGAVAVIATFVWTLVKDRETIAQTNTQLSNQISQFTEQQQQARNQFANQQFIAAAGLLNQTAVGTHIAGLYAIQQIAEAQPSQYLVPATRAIIGFIKSSTASIEKKVDQDWPPVEPDTQSAISILAMLNGDAGHHISVDLHGVYLVQANFTCPRTCGAFVGANFQSAKLYVANFSDLDLSGAEFDGSYMADWEAYDTKWRPSTEDYENTHQDYAVNFNNSNLSRAGFDHVYMGGAMLENTCLAAARFWATDLSRVSFKNANLGGSSDCNFMGKKAHFYQATLTEANFDNVDIGDVNFAMTKLSNADFSKAINVEKANFDRACGDDTTKFPPSIKINLAQCPKQQ
jgi:uncharacterized protein YjbI with pentapeptide repeats